MATILVDFDGTCVPTLPIGSKLENYDSGAEKVLKRLISSGHNIVLWTVRNDSSQNPYNVVARQFTGKSSLAEAVGWFMERNIPLYGINEVPDEISKVGSGRKILGDYLIDDTAIGTPMKKVTVKYFSYFTDDYCVIETVHVDWDKVEKYLEELELI